MSNNYQIDPEDVFVDAANIPRFDTAQHEGDSEVSLVTRTSGVFIVSSIMLLIILVGSLTKLQIVEGGEHAERTQENNFSQQIVIHERGKIYDRNNNALAWNEKDESGLLRRVYDAHPALSHIIGYTSQPELDSSGYFYSTSFAGISGLELQFDDTLSGQNGMGFVERKATGELVGSTVAEEPVPGKDLTLSLDVELQKIIYEEIIASMAEFGYESGAGVVMDVTNGQIVSMTSAPGFDLNVFTDRNSKKAKELRAQYVTDPAKPLFNRAVSGALSPGSIVKTLVAVKALEENVISPHKQIYSPGYLRLDNPYNPSQYSQWRDWGPTAYGNSDVVRALAVSSNVYFLTVGGGYKDQPGIGISGINEIMAKYGYGQTTGSGYPGEVVGNVPSPEWKSETFNEDWRLGDTYNTAIGQYGFSVTPLQVSRVVTALASNKLYQPQFLLTDKPIVEDGYMTSDSVLSFVHQGMKAGVEYGTGKSLNLPYIEVAAKTGTAELGADKQLVNSWTTGYFPAHDPQFAFVVVMEKGSRYNTSGATTVMKRVFERLHQEIPENIYTK